MKGVYLKKGNIVYDPLMGLGVVKEIKKTVLYVNFNGKDIKYDAAHAKQFLYKRSIDK